MADGLVQFTHFYNNLKITYEKEKNIYHYTSAEGAKEILANQTLRFSDRYFLNDYSEGKYVFELCVQHIEEMLDPGEFKDSIKAYLEQRIKNPQIDCFYVYQCSFSTNKDSLCMWNYYTKSDSIKGFNLKFDKMEDYDLLKIKSKDGFGKLKVYSGKVIYDTDKQISTLKDVLNQFEKFTRRSGLPADMIAKYAVDKIAHIGEFFKKSCFGVEEEYRISISPVLNDNGTFMTIDYERKFREKNGLFIPYIDIEFNSESLVGITMSPTLNPDDTIQSILSLTKNKYHNITKDSIVPSEIPIRY